MSCGDYHTQFKTSDGYHIFQPLVNNLNPCFEIKMEPEMTVPKSKEAIRYHDHYISNLRDILKEGVINLQSTQEKLDLFYEEEMHSNPSDLRELSHELVALSNALKKRCQSLLTSDEVDIKDVIE